MTPFVKTGWLSRMCERTAWHICYFFFFNDYLIVVLQYIGKKWAMMFPLWILLNIIFAIKTYEHSAIKLVPVYPFCFWKPTHLLWNKSEKDKPTSYCFTIYTILRTLVLSSLISVLVFFFFFFISSLLWAFCVVDQMCIYSLALDSVYIVQ